MMYRKRMLEVCDRFGVADVLITGFGSVWRPINHATDTMANRLDRPLPGPGVLPQASFCLLQCCNSLRFRIGPSLKDVM